MMTLMTRKWMVTSFIIFFLNFPLQTHSNTTTVYNTQKEALNEFAFDLYKQVTQPNQNIILSPYSLSSLLVILLNGAQGTTQQQLAKLLHFNEDNGNKFNLEAIDANLLGSNACPRDAYCKSDDNNSVLLIANALWADRSFSYIPAFLTALQQAKITQFHQADFKNLPEKARNTINNWVEKKTNNYIQHLIPQGVISEDTKLILVNAIYFNGLWALPFQPKDTATALFLLENGTSVQTPMMKQEDRFLYKEDAHLQILQLGYKNSAIRLAILLPKGSYTVQQVLRNLDQNTFSKLINASTEQKIQVNIPRFKLESTFNALNTSLQKMGLKDAFTDQANFSRMTKSPLSISAILQKAIIEVDEKGTVAAAATATIMTATAAFPQPVIQFNANHPFLLVLFDTKSGIILFIGQVVNPTGT
ncbi:serpin family protein [Legionella maceachernii]|nr:serpin family protein [Legionella maceachernii]